MIQIVARVAAQVTVAICASIGVSANILAAIYLQIYGKSCKPNYWHVMKLNKNLRRVLIGMSHYTKLQQNSKENVRIFSSPECLHWSVRITSPLSTTTYICSTFLRAINVGSDGKYQHSKVSISIDTAGPVIDKYRYFPFVRFDRKMLKFFQENLPIFRGKFYVFRRKTHDFSIKNR